MTRERSGSARRVAGLVFGLVLAAGAAGAGDGDPDPAFGSGDGRVMLNWLEHSRATAVEPIAGGRLLVAGTIDSAPPRWGVAKLSATGGIEGFSTKFDLVAEGAAAVYQIFDIAVDASDRILLAGWVENPDENPRPALARLTAAGQLDPTFDGDGLQIIDAIPGGWYLSTIADAQLLPDGRAVFFGNCAACSGANPGMFLLRTTAAGAPDPAIQGTGWMSLGARPELQTAWAYALRVAPNGVMTLAATGAVAGGERSYVARLHASGALDSAFDDDGYSELVDLGGAHFSDLAIDPVTGQIVLATASSGLSLGGLVAFDATGALDTGFGSAGFLDLDIEEGARIDAVAFESGGRVVAAGTINANGTQTAGFLLARASARGVLDPAFDGNGLKRVEFDRTVDAEDRAVAATLSGGRLVVVGVARGAALDDAFAILRVESTLVFTDGFERGGAGGWTGE